MLLRLVCLNDAAGTKLFFKDIYHVVAYIHIYTYEGSDCINKLKKEGNVCYVLGVSNKINNSGNPNPNPDYKCSKWDHITM